MTNDSVKIGLEIHAYVRTRAKLFCACRADFLAAPEPNTFICPVCTGQPGAKPMAPNAAALAAGARLAHHLGATLSTSGARFLRKHYFYPDLASNYQRTSEPLARGGTLAGAPLTEIHLEEDPGAFEPTTGLVDYNRSGAPLLEIVTEPHVRDAAHARAMLAELRLTLDYLGIGYTEAGLKADCNVSVAGGPRAEVKNVNSARSVEVAIAYEISRQREAVARGETLVQETRHFDDASGRTTRLRTKETVADYRYMADPDLPLVAIARLPAEETLAARRARLASPLAMPPETLDPLFAERVLVDSYEAIAERAPPRAAFEFVLRDLRGELEFRKTTLLGAALPNADLARLVAALAAKRVTQQVATRILRDALDAKRSLAAGLDAELAAGVQTGDEVLEAAREAVREHPQALADWKTGKAQAAKFLVGAVMKKTKGRADPTAANRAVEAALREAA
ncbi:MAG: Asp-tRNA(Asn)/Glu-tRNA(Gln) amidotransferase subunit GatB [Thermoplasmatota archaeon]